MGRRSPEKQFIRNHSSPSQNLHCSVPNTHMWCSEFKELSRFAEELELKVRRYKYFTDVIISEITNLSSNVRIYLPR